MSLPFLSAPPSCPCHFLGMSASFSMYVPFFRCESFPYISRRADWFPCIPPALPLFSFLSLSCSFQFPFVSLSFPSFPCTSLHFPFAPQHFPHKTRGFQRFRKENVKKHSFSSFSAKGGRKPKPAKSRQLDSSLGPLFCDTGSPNTTFNRLVERHQITAQHVGDPPAPCTLRIRVILYPLLGVRHFSAMLADTMCVEGNVY